MSDVEMRHGRKRGEEEEVEVTCGSAGGGGRRSASGVAHKEDRGVKISNERLVGMVVVGFAEWGWQRVRGCR